MSDDNSTEQTGPVAETARIDLSQYRTGELADQLAQLVSVPGAVGKVLRTSLICSILFSLSCYLMFGFSELSTIPWFFACTYSLAAGICLGIVLGVLRVMATTLVNVESILGLILDITGCAAEDYEELQTGAMKRPSTTELITQVYDDVIVPVLERTVAGTFGIFSKPLLWAYRRTIGGAVRYLIRRVPLAIARDKHNQQVVDAVEADIDDLARYTDSIQIFATSAAGIVTTVGKRIRTFALIPLYLLLGTALVLAISPFVLSRLFVTPGNF
jgi:hypothetical protein